MAFDFVLEMKADRQAKQQAASDAAKCPAGTVPTYKKVGREIVEKGVSVDRYELQCVAPDKELAKVTKGRQ